MPILGVESEGGFSRGKTTFWSVYMGPDQIPRWRRDRRFRSRLRMEPFGVIAVSDSEPDRPVPYTRLYGMEEGDICKLELSDLELLSLPPYTGFDP